jgi:hypothetical protein
LGNIGVEADLTQDVGGAARGQLRRYAALAFGRGEADRSGIEGGLPRGQSDVGFVDGLAPITPLLVAQFEEALARRSEVERKIASVAAANGRIELELDGPARVVVSVDRLTRLYRTRMRGCGRAAAARPAGRLSSPRRLRAREAFAVVSADTDNVRVVRLAAYVPRAPGPGR